MLSDHPLGSSCFSLQLLEKQIDELREQMIQAYHSSQSFTEHHVLQISKDLDYKINEYLLLLRRG